MIPRYALSLALTILASCSHYRGAGDLRSCYDMHNNTGAIRDLSEQISGLEGKRAGLSKDPEKNHEAIRRIGTAIREKQERIDDLEKESQRQARNCEPMFEDPQTERARDQGYRKD